MCRFSSHAHEQRTDKPLREHEHEFCFSFSLEELQICSNQYNSITSTDFSKHERLKRLYISNNQLKQWRSICALGWLFPQLEVLIASNNPLESFRSDDDLQQCFPHLTTLSLDQVEISDWQDIIALTTLSRLQAVRIYSAPLLQVRRFK